MLRLTILGEEFYNETSEEFTSLDDIVLDLEHSLVSLSKWESKYGKPFLGPDKKSSEEALGYVESMIMSEGYPSDTLTRLTPENFTEINTYMGSPQSATTFNSAIRHRGRGPQEVITSELIYYWMVAFTIPLACETWHLNRLFALIQICNIKNSKQKNVPRNEIANRNRELNEQRKAQLNTNG